MKKLTEDIIVTNLESQLGNSVAISFNMVNMLMVRLLDREYIRRGFTFQFDQVPVLAIVHLAGDSLLSQQDIATLIKRDKSSVRRSLQVLERDGYVQTLADTADKRKKLIRLTDKGKLVVEMAFSTASRFDDFLAKELSTDELDQLNQTLKKMHALYERQLAD
ncbi:MarR family transcriptional regulator [Siphonobacter sp. BAB-5385]|uniref:MarR family winged helix-turn-helix transcriptional regulator n=1 Tax=Siphonobacter sp. BAB-5385 TaxID=1864822 RepID=UPI000B9DDF89|nr:MarR family transcriptional regulator [Siphonobacter sp. BAB-5385]OZI09710.1 MarR family transcriptional regulator [Siphonobacter sp. BAB-5385]